MTKISVLLPVYNTDPVHLREAIDSVLSQSFSDFELLIYNDASTSALVDQIVKSYNDDRIRYFHETRNMGIAKVRNKLMELATGEYLAVMDHDDICLPQRFEKQVAFMDSHPEVGVCGTAHKRFGKLFKNNVITYPVSDADIRVALFFKNVIHHPSAMIRKAIIDTHHIRYDETLVSVNDRKLFVTIGRVSKLANLKDVLCLYRMHEGMTSKKKRHQISEEQKRFRHDMLEQMGVHLNDETLFNDYIMNGRARIKDAAILNEIEQTLASIVQKNQETGFLPSQEFAKICAQYLVKRCYNAMMWGRVSSKHLLAATTLPVSQIKQPVLLKLFNTLAR